MPPDFPDDEDTSDAHLTDEWYEEQEVEWSARREEGLRRFPVGSVVEAESRGPGVRGVVVSVDSMGDLHIDMEGEGVGIWTYEHWGELKIPR